jgi:hypothetical protein
VATDVAAIEDAVFSMQFTLKLYNDDQVHKLHVALRIPYVYDYKTKLCRTQAEVILNDENLNVRGIRQEAIHRMYKRLKLSGSQAYDSSAN